MILKQLYFKGLITCVISIVISFVTILFPLYVDAQNKTDYDLSQYIEKKDTLINLKFGLFNTDQRYEIEGDGFHFKLQPNFTLKTKFYFSYRFLSVAFAFAPEFIPGNGDQELKGKTKTFTLNAHFIGKHWVHDFQYNYTRGYYLTNTSDYPPQDTSDYQSSDWIEGTDPYTQFPDLRVYSIKGATSYKFNRKFSLRAIRTQTEIQKKSTGTFMPSFLYGYYRINNSSADTNHCSSQKSDNFEAMASVWYIHNFVVKKIYLSAGLAPAIGYSLTRLDTRMGSDHIISFYHQPIFRLNEQVSVGFSSHRFFTGAVLVASQTMGNQGGNPIKENSFYTTFHIFVGYRFNAPKIFRSTFDWAEGVAKSFKNNK